MTAEQLEKGRRIDAELRDLKMHAGFIANLNNPGNIDRTEIMAHLIDWAAYKKAVNDKIERLEKEFAQL